MGCGYLSQVNTHLTLFYSTCCDLLYDCAWPLRPRQHTSAAALLRFKKLLQTANQSRSSSYHMREVA